MGKTVEHKAWEMLVARIGYLNGFAGNRSEMARFTKMVNEILEKAKEEANGRDLQKR